MALSKVRKTARTLQKSTTYVQAPLPSSETLPKTPRTEHALKVERHASVGRRTRLHELAREGRLRMLAAPRLVSRWPPRCSRRRRTHTVSEMHWARLDRPVTPEGPQGRPESRGGSRFTPARSDWPPQPDLGKPDLSRREARGSGPHRSSSRATARGCAPAHYRILSRLNRL